MTTFDPVVNLFSSVVVTPPSPATSGTTLTLTAGDGALLPDPATAGHYNLAVGPDPTGLTDRQIARATEIVRVTALATDTITITRAQEGTTARTVVAGDVVTLSITKAFLDALTAAINAGGGGSSGPASQLVKLFDSTLAADTASIDTGANGIAQDCDLLEVYLLARTDEAVALSTLTLEVNGDAGANYDRQFLRGSNVTASASIVNASNGWTIATAGASATAGVYGVFRITIPAYAQTTAFKNAEATVSVPDETAANMRAEVQALGWRSTAAINQLSVAAPGVQKLKAGSRLLIYGRRSAMDGWTNAGETWTYVSATSFKATGVDVTAKYSPGTRVRLKQGGGYKWFVVVSSSFSTDTTVTVTAGSDNSLANAAITDNYYSYDPNPQGWPGWFNFTCNATGFSSKTSDVGKFMVVGRSCQVIPAIVGTSNATTFTWTLPIANQGIALVIPLLLTDNGNSLLGRAVLSAGSTTVTMNPAVVSGTAVNLGSNPFTASGTKAANGTGPIVYEI